VGKKERKKEEFVCVCVTMFLEKVCQKDMGNSVKEKKKRKKECWD